jgi:hypothetical protein
MPHWQATRSQAEMMRGGIVLFVQDTSELDFFCHWTLNGAGHLNDIGYGSLMHSCLAQSSPQLPVSSSLLVRWSGVEEYHGIMEDYGP